jgi:type 2 lantibiotic biosynthesis protein LanM
MTAPGGDAFLETATFLGRRLCRDALWAGERCNWLGDSMEFVEREWRVVHRALGPDLYGGTSGVALFLASLHRLTGEPLFRATAEGAIAHALARVEEIPPPQRLAFYSGWTGIAHALAPFDAAASVDKASGLIAAAAREVRDPGLDVISGAAGAIPALIDLQRHGKGHDLLAIAVRLGEHLVATARKSDAGWSWNTLEGQTTRDLTGFSHGAAGIAWALLELFAATSDTRFRDAAERGFAYERQWFSPEQENWPDFRSIAAPAGGSDAPGYALAWCHGAPGIGLSRLRAYEILGSDTARHEAEAAIRSTKRLLTHPALAQSDHALCHGRAGNAELLIYAAEVLGDETARAAAETVGRQGIEAFCRHDLPWPCGVPGGGETPSLMLGLAGIGYFYLRLYDPAGVPSVLLVKPREPVRPAARDVKAPRSRSEGRNRAARSRAASRPAGAGRRRRRDRAR